MAHVPYVVTFHMPVIPPPPNLVTLPIPHYAAFAANLTVTPSGVDDGLVIEGIPLASAEIYAMSGGLVRYVPAGGVLPLSAALAPAGGAVVLPVMAADVGRQRGGFAPGVPPMNTVIYLNLDEVAVKAALRLQAQVMTALQLEASYETGHGNVPLQGVDLLEDHMTRAMAGTASTLVPGGAILGKAAVIDALFPALGARLEVRQITANTPNAYAPVLPVLAGAPMFETSVPGAHWIDHPLVLQAQAAPSAAEFHLRFAVWNPLAETYDPIANATVMVAKDVNGTSTPLAGLTGPTDANGVVHLSTVDLGLLLDTDRGLHFEIDLQGKNQHFNAATQAFGAFPMSTWSTKGWRTADGVWAGGYEGFQGARVGDAAAPAEFRVGMDFTIDMVWSDPVSKQLFQFPPGVVVDVIIKRGNSGTIYNHYTDKAGRISGIVYKTPMQEDADVYIRVRAVMVDLADPTNGAVASFASIVAHLPSDIVDYGPFASACEMRFAYTSRGLPRPLGSPTRPVYQLDVRQENPAPDEEEPDPDLFSAQIYTLQCFREFLNVMLLFVPTLATHQWNNGNGLKFSMTNDPTAWTGCNYTTGNALSTYRRANLVDTFPWATQAGQDAFAPFQFMLRRGVIIHEIAHALLLSYSGSQKDENDFANHNPGTHEARLKSNEFFAYTEGMAEFFAGMFTQPEMIFFLFPRPEVFDDVGNPSFHWSRPFNGFEPDGHTPLPVADNMDVVSVVQSGSPPTRAKQPFGPPREENGYRVEGAFATALYMIFNEFVANSSHTNPVAIKSTLGDCDVIAANPWMSAALSNSTFKDIIWAPISAFLPPLSDETTTKYVEAMRAANDDVWPRLKDVWNRLHISVNEPTISKVTSPIGMLYDGFNPDVPIPQFMALPNVVIEGGDYPATLTVGTTDPQGTDHPVGSTVVTTNQITVTLPPLSVGTHRLYIETTWGRTTFPAMIEVA